MKQVSLACALAKTSGVLTFHVVATNLPLLVPVSVLQLLGMQLNMVAAQCYFEKLQA